jgi:hemoglobin
METNNPIPSPYEWAGGIEKMEYLTKVFYEKVMKDPILEPIFKHMSPEHSKHVAAFISESFGGGDLYSKNHGDNTMIHVVGKHLGKHLNETHRKRWLQLMLETADDIGMPDDPEFRSVLVGHLEWGTRLAVLFSGDTDNPMTTQDHIPEWGWGEVGGPFGTVESIFRRKTK